MSINILWAEALARGHSNETVTPGKHVTKCKNMRKWMVQFIRNSESRGDKIARVNSIHITKSINLF